MTKPSLAHTHAIVPLSSGNVFFAQIQDSNVSILDTVDAQNIKSPLFNENVLVSEILTTKIIFFRIITETTTSILDVLTLIPIKIRQFFETNIILDVLTLIPMKIRQLFETNLIVDSINSIPRRFRELSEINQILENFIIKPILFRVINENVLFSEIITTTIFIAPVPVSTKKLSGEVCLNDNLSEDVCM